MEATEDGMLDGGGLEAAHSQVWRLSRMMMLMLMMTALIARVLFCRATAAER
jgi:hypothetical protein